MYQGQKEYAERSNLVSQAKVERKKCMTEYSQLYEEYGQPFTGRKRRRLEEFLHRMNLLYDEGVQYTVNLVTEEGEIAATGSLRHNVIQCVAVDSRYQGEGASARVVTLLLNHAMERGQSHLFVFTKPQNRAMFSGLGFYPILQTEEVLFMENARDGIQRYVRSLERPQQTGGVIGAAVMNCNPFTNGHRYLIETAAGQCDALHLFVLSEDRSAFPAEVRYELVRQGIAGLDNVILHHTSDYLISSAVFPTYFLKDQARAGQINCELDLRIFCAYFAKELSITRRFVGTEPFCPVTSAYNREMKRVLGEYGIEVVEIPRKKLDGREISASRVRACLREGDYEAIEKMVPPSTWRFLRSEEGQAIAEKLRQEADPG